MTPALRGLRLHRCSKDIGLVDSSHLCKLSSPRRHYQKSYSNEKVASSRAHRRRSRRWVVHCQAKPVPHYNDRKPRPKRPLRVLPSFACCVLGASSVESLTGALSLDAQRWRTAAYKKICGLSRHAHAKHGCAAGRTADTLTLLAVLVSYRPLAPSLDATSTGGRQSSAEPTSSQT